MKTIYTLVLLMFVNSLIRAQIPNASFEHWTNSTPNGWYITDPATIVRTTNAYDSTYAVRLNVVMEGPFASSGYLWSGDSGTDGNFPLASVPAALNGWMIGHFAGSDQMTINAQVSINGLVAGSIGINVAPNSAVYKQFSFSFDTANVTPGADSAYLEFGLINITTGALDTTTYYIIDDLSMGPFLNLGTGIAQPNANAFLETCSPNPASNTANIIYSITGNSTISVTMYDVLGNKVRTLLDGMQQTPGRYKIPTDVSMLGNGVYFYSLNVDGQSYTQKMIVSK